MKLLVILTYLGAMAAAAWAEGPVPARRLSALMPSAEMALQQAGALGLTAEQQAKLQGDTADLTRQADQWSEQIREESSALATLLTSEKVDEAAIETQFDKVLMAENALKRLRLKMSLRARAVLTTEQIERLEKLTQVAGRRGESPEQQELAAKMERVKNLLEKAKSEGRDLGAAREMWKRVSQATQQRNLAEAGRILDEAAKLLETGGKFPSAGSDASK